MRAHLLSVEQLEELRMLTNSEMDSRATFACLLLGQPTLRRRLRQGVFAALDQRIALRCTIDGMDRKETGDTSPITSSSPAAQTRCSPMTRSR